LIFLPFSVGFLLVYLYCELLGKYKKKLTIQVLKIKKLKIKFFRRNNNLHRKKTEPTSFESKFELP